LNEMGSKSKATLSSYYISSVINTHKVLLFIVLHNTSSLNCVDNIQTN